MTYPQAFPSVPPTVTPCGEERWSGHQYGDGGELCLEWGPDNWLPEVTGADMIASTVKLLRTERRQAKPEERGRVETRHDMTLGQDARGETLRLISTETFRSALQDVYGCVEATFSVRYGKPLWRAMIVSMRWDGGAHEWADPSLPLAIIDEGVQVAGRVLVGLDRLPSLTGSADEVWGRLPGAATQLPDEDQIVFCAAKDGQMSAAYLYTKKNVAFQMFIVAGGAGGTRLQEVHASLAERQVAVVGCGSIGSKVTASLARSGVRRFLLIDDDLMLPENIVRHDLDWGGVGSHKVDALADRIRRIVPDADVTVRRHRLGGQESNGSLDSAVSAMRKTDLIVEATADGRAFNYASAGAGAKVPMIWAEVFGGGFGVAIARSRPGLDPTPQVARALIEGWCRDRAMPTPPARDRYHGGSDDQPMVADDAVVSLAASVASSVALDVLLGRDPSRYEHSAYLIGMAAEWIFDRPLDVWPIDLGPPSPGVPPVDYDDPAARHVLQQLNAIIERAKA
jgi:sulfur-carrier protein adenylyltransferase/sulfurtransferase